MVATSVAMGQGSFLNILVCTMEQNYNKFVVQKNTPCSSQGVVNEYV
jgi:hypothetical protein